ncbi:zinc-binding dehydrogenase [Alcanivorax sp. 1008]|uniref:zinc-binding dehydrogenase n=1 Tax=Alcanivorax sp. 1008 TaxID=2816853 RepID=UPI001E4913D4|nr:zinc-binding dehydrogenase [Alcanivorax sp. 1008]
MNSLTLQSESVPELDARAVRVQVTAVGLNFADIFALTGLYSATPEGSFIPGLEYAGEIVAIGQNVEGFCVGDRVMGVTRFGGYATVIDSPEEYVHLIPPGWDDAQGAAFLAQTLTAWYALKALGDIQPGHKVLIHSAAGGVGLQAMRLARAVGAIPVGSVGSADKLELLLSEGFSDVLVREHSFSSQLRRQGRRFDLVLDAIGGEVQLASFAALEPMGRLVVFGAAEFTPTGSRPNYFSAIWKFLRRPRYDVMSMISENKSVLAFNLIWLWQRQERMHALLDELQQIDLPPPYVGHQFPFSDAHGALDCLRSGKSTGKVVLRVNLSGL